MGISDDIAKQVLSAGTLSVSAPGEKTERWAPVAFDVAPGGRYGAVAMVSETSRRGWYAFVEVCRRAESGHWESLEGNGDAWGSDPRTRPDQPRFESATGVFGFARDGVWMTAVAGVVGAGVSSVRVSEPAQRKLAVNPDNGAFVALITAEGAPRPPAFALVALDGESEVDRLDWQPAAGMFDDGLAPPTR